LFRPLAHCPWQAFARIALKVGARDTVSEELDPAEVGTAVHLALERAAPLLTWRPSDEEGPAARAAAAALLAEATGLAFAEQRDALGGLSPARASAVTGGGARWADHWKTWVEGRIREPFGAPTVIAQASLPAQPAWQAAVDRLSALLPPGVPAQRRDLAVLRLARLKAAGDAPDRESALGTNTDGELPLGALDALRQLWVDPVLDRLAAVWRALEERAAVLLEPLTAVLAEVHLEDVPVQLGPVAVRITGQVDRVDRVGQWLRIVDYKTARMPPPRVLQGWLTGGQEPQLLVYALALRAAAWPPEHPLAGATVAAAGWDYLRDTLEYDRRDPKRAVQTDRLVVSDDLLDGAAARLGAQVADAAAGRWPLAPRKETCPMLTGWGHDHCAYAGACRLRGLPE
jgi:RecB family exonuclease